jgi:hypothetical protein
MRGFAGAMTWNRLGQAISGEKGLAREGRASRQDRLGRVSVEMSRIIAWIKNLLGFGRDDEELPEVELEVDQQDEAEGDPFAPRPDRAVILAEVKRDAEADAIRHAEDMLDRDFPIVPRAENTAGTRLATLRSVYVERRGELSGRIAVLDRRANELALRLQATERALAAEGVPPSQIGLEPLRGKRAVIERIAVALGALVVMGLAVDLLDLRGRLVLPGVGLLFALLLLILMLQPGERLEEPAIEMLREQRQQQDEALTELQGDLHAHREALTKLDRTTYAIAESEVSFAGEMASTYNSTVFSALPAGVLAEGRELREQQRPAVRMPSWARGLAGAE